VHGLRAGPRSVRDAEVAGSNPASPTSIYQGLPHFLRTAVSPAAWAYVEARQSGALFEITPQGLNAWLHRAGFPGGMHSFRHAYRARLRHARIGAERQRALMGHGPKEVTSGYGVVAVEKMLGTAEGLSA